MTGQTAMHNFRIMPAQKLDRVTHSGTRYGFIIKDHPNGVRTATGHVQKGDFLASWSTREEAEIARCILGCEDPVQPIGYFIPDKSEGYGHD